MAVTQYCRGCKCSTVWETGVGLQSTTTVYGDFVGEKTETDLWKPKPDQRGRTCGPGPGKLVAVAKCTECGRSYTI